MDMEEINLSEFFRYYISKVLFVIIAIVVVIIIGNVYNLITRVPMYESNTTIVLATERKDDQDYTQSDVLLNQNLVSTYSEIIKSRKVMSQVIKNVKLKCNVSELSNLVTVSSVEDTEIIKITVKNSDKKKAKEIANAIVPVFSEEVERIYGIKNVSVVDPAILAKAPSNINYVKENIIYILVGFVLSSGIIFIVYYFDTSIKSVDIVEDKFKLTVLGTVPKVDRGDV